MNKNLKKVAGNDKGRDFVVGDLHGCFDELWLLLTHVNFDPSVDRLFSVGDLVDRGPKNMDCARLLKEDWFYCVKGNHEELMYLSILKQGGDWAPATWVGNGGMWFADEDMEQLKQLSKLMVDLPLVIAVGEGADRFNIVHGELYHDAIIEGGGGTVTRIPLTDNMIDGWVFDDHAEQQMLWGRSIIQSGKVVSYKWHDSNQMSLTFCGHTPIRKVMQYGQQMFIDLGGVFYHYSKSISHDNAIVLAEPGKKRYFRYGMVVGSITEHDFDSVEKWAM